jgi:outer membrane biosynthesis protein TonB
MSYIYEPEIEEEDDGYSIPKILVALLLFVLIGVGGYIIYQGRQIKTLNQTFMSQQDSLKVFEKELETMILKYNLAIDDNGSLSDELKGERDRIIRFRDSIRRLEKNNKTISVEEYNKALKTIKDNNTVALEEQVKTNEIKQVNDQTNANKESLVTRIDTPKVATKVLTEDKIETVATNNTVNTVQSFERVEVPPTYPGCTGDATQKKACFNQKVRAALGSKFDPSVASDLNLASGVQKIMINFTVDKFGNVTNIRAKGSHPKLEAEAVKATKSLPKMTAARQNGAPVDVVYNVPISFVIE